MSAGPGKTSVLDAAELLTSSCGALRYCKKARAASQVDLITAAISGRTKAQLKDEKLTGTHWMRNIGGDVTEYLAWSAKDSDILGDWATPQASAGDSAAKQARATAKSKAKSKSTRQKFYRANAPQDEQVEVRTRFYGAVAAAIQAYGIANLTWETTWREIIPPMDKAPLELVPFYGCRPGHSA